jgi:hypothetical protein
MSRVLPAQANTRTRELRKMLIQRQIPHAIKSKKLQTTITVFKRLDKTYLVTLFNAHYGTSWYAMIRIRIAEDK